MKELAYGAILQNFAMANKPVANPLNMALSPEPPIVNFQSGLDAVPSAQPTTVLGQNEEQQFQNWIRSTDWFKEFVQEYNEEPDLNIDEYDYRAAWKAGISPERDPYDNNRYHWPSSDQTGKMLKSEEHPTAWKEFFMRDTGLNPDALGLQNKQEADLYLEMIQQDR